MELTHEPREPESPLEHAQRLLQTRAYYIGRFIGVCRLFRMPGTGLDACINQLLDVEKEWEAEQAKERREP